MKKFITLAIIIIGTVILAVPKHAQYTVINAAYDHGEIITPLDQNIWWYESDKVPSNCVVTVVFDDNGTPSIYDDIILDVIAQ